jgi:signal transduction histidine kinase
MRTLELPAMRDLQRSADAVLATGLAAWAVFEVSAVSADRQTEVGLVFAALAMTVPLAWRRRLPSVAVALLAFAITAQSLFTDPPEAIWTLVATIVASYSVAAYDRSLRRSLVALAVLAAAVGLSIARDTSDEATNIPPTLLIFLAVPWVAGRTLHRRELRTVSLSSQVGALERENALVAREAVADERNRIARELHDVVAHSLSVIAIQADAAEAALGRDAELAREPLAAVKDTAREALREMRHLLGLLKVDDDAASREPQPGLAMLRALVDQVRAAGLDVDLAIEGEPGQVSPGVDLAAFRIIQEGLTNVLKHALATRARSSSSTAPTAFRSRCGTTASGVRARRMGRRVKVWSGCVNGSVCTTGRWTSARPSPASASKPGSRVDQGPDCR